MNLLISQRIGLNQHGIPMDSLEGNYVTFFSSFGFHCFPVSNFSPDVPALARELNPHGIVLIGGNDVHEENDFIQYRNNTEDSLLQYAIKNKIPLLGICRGIQFIHHSFGGKLKSAQGHVRVTHPLIVQSSRFYQIGEGQKEVLVNSYHAQGLDEPTLSSDFEVVARCKTDNAIEAIIHKSQPILGIMWHPERDYLDQDKSFNRNLIHHFFKI